MPDPFCDAKKMQRQTYYETPTMRLIYDISPVVPGHSLLIPKRHILSILELSNEELLEMHDVLKKAVPVLLKTYSCDSYNLTMQVGRNAGMTVLHMHMHIIPRRAGDPYSVDNNKIYEDVAKERAATHSSVEKEIARLRDLFNAD